jgi:hypothetical protein
LALFHQPKQRDNPVQIKLLTDVLEADRFGAKTLKTTMRAGKSTIAWVAGTVIEVSEATGEKFISRGQAEKFSAPIVGDNEPTDVA